MTKYMSKKSYGVYLLLKDTFAEALEACAQEISLISNGRELIGEFNGVALKMEESKKTVATEANAETDLSYLYG